MFHYIYQSQSWLKGFDCCPSLGGLGLGRPPRIRPRRRLMKEMRIIADRVDYHDYRDYYDQGSYI